VVTSAARTKAGVQSLIYGLSQLPAASPGKRRLTPPDSFQPPSLTRAQAKALTAARSVTVRMFTKSEDADQHCQIGNIGLACRVLTTWLRNTSPEPNGPG
jgi:hypothetical protein